MERTTNNKSLSSKMKRHTSKDKKVEAPFKGNFETMISTGSTLLDLAISGKRIRGGGLPGGILVEAFGPSQSGKTALLSEIAGNIDRAGGDTQFHDPEARLDQEFARIFGMKLKKKNYSRPDTVTEVFHDVFSWEPQPTSSNPNVINGILADSLAALSTDMEMENEDGDKMGMRRAKEFSEGFRKTCRRLKQKNLLMVASNQIRINMEAANKYSPKYTTPGGEATKFYSSVRLKFNNPTKVPMKIKLHGKEKIKIIGSEVEIEVVKSVDEPYRKATIFIIYGYGIDDIRANLQYIKENTNNKVYTVGGEDLDNSMEKSIKLIEKDPELIIQLREEVIDLWEEIDSKFNTIRIPKIRK